MAEQSHHMNNIDCTIYVGVMDSKYHWTKFAFHHVLCRKCKRAVDRYQRKILYCEWPQNTAAKIWFGKVQTRRHDGGGILRKTENIVGWVGQLWPNSSLSLWWEQLGYSLKITKAERRRKTNSHHVLESGWCDIRFLVHETINPREVRQVKNFTVRLDQRWCDCG